MTADLRALPDFPEDDPRAPLLAALRESHRQWGAYGTKPGDAYRTLERALRTYLWAALASTPEPAPVTEGLDEWLRAQRYVHANIEGKDPANGATIRVCATDRQAWPCEPVRIIDHVRAYAAASPSPETE